MSHDYATRHKKYATGQYELNINHSAFNAAREYVHGANHLIGLIEVDDNELLLKGNALHINNQFDYFNRVRSVGDQWPVFNGRIVVFVIEGNFPQITDVGVVHFVVLEVFYIQVFLL